MIKYAKIEGYKNLGEVGIVGSHLYQWMSEKENLEGLREVIIVRAYDVEKPIVFKGIVYSRTLRYYPLEITEDLTELEKLVGELTVVDLKDLSDVLSQFKIIHKRRNKKWLKKKY